MLSKWQATIMLLAGTIFAGFEIWGFVSPVPKEAIDLVVTAIFALLAILFPATKLFQAVKYEISKVDVESLKKVK